MAVESVAIKLTNEGPRGVGVQLSDFTNISNVTIVLCYISVYIVKIKKTNKYTIQAN